MEQAECPLPPPDQPLQEDAAEAEDEEAEGDYQLGAGVGEPGGDEGELEGEGAKEGSQDLAVAVPAGEELHLGDDHQVDSHPNQPR